MTDAGFFRVSANPWVTLFLWFLISFVCFQGTSADQVNRFSDKEKKLLKQMKFEEVVMTTKVDLAKVKLDVIKPWITKRVAALLGMEDDVIVEFIFNQLEDEKV